MEFLNACAVAMSLLRDLEAGCERIAIAGDVRRREKEVRGIELVVVPLVNMYDETNLFGETSSKRIDIMDHLLEARLKDKSWGWEEDGIWWNPKHKRLYNGELDVRCDLSYCKIGSWGCAMALHTGNPPFSYMLAMFIKELGFHIDGGYFLHKHDEPQGGCRAGERCKFIVACPTEEAFFKQLGLPCIAPRLRTEEKLKDMIKESKPYYGRSSF